MTVLIAARVADSPFVGMRPLTCAGFGERETEIPYGQETETAERTGSYPIRRRLAGRRPLGFFGDRRRPLVGGQKGELMEWARILAYITGTVDQELLLRNEYLVDPGGPVDTAPEAIVEPSFVLLASGTLMPPDARRHLGDLPGCCHAPERDEDFAGKRHDHLLTQAPSARGARLEPEGQRALLLPRQPAPGELDHAAAR